MEEFADVSRARSSYKLFLEAMSAGREIMRRVGVPDPPAVPTFDMVFKRLSADSKKELYSALSEKESLTPAEAIRIWQPFVRRAFGAPPTA